METLRELETRLQRSRFDKYLEPQGRQAFFDFIKDRSILVDVSARISACADSDDDKFLSLAVSGRADFVITGNLKDFPPSPFQGIKIVNPATFLVLTTNA